YSPLSQADLGRRLGLDRNDVNGIVTRLEQEGQIERRADPADPRRHLRTVTRTGRARLDELRRYTDAVQDELLATLSPAERRQLQALLAKGLAGHQPQPA